MREERSRPKKRRCGAKIQKGLEGLRSGVREERNEAIEKIDTGLVMMDMRLNGYV